MLWLISCLYLLSETTGLRLDFVLRGKLCLLQVLEFDFMLLVVETLSEQVHHGLLRASMRVKIRRMSIDEHLFNTFAIARMYAVDR